MTATTERPGPGPSWDGKVLPFLPGRRPVPAAVRFVQPAADVDPVTYEVLRYALFQSNEDHGRTIAKLAASPIVLYTNDFNPVVLTAAGEVVFFGPYVQWLGGMMDVVAKYLLEYLAENPGIRPGDMFLTNDPWIGTTHQQDLAVLCPVFDGEELVAWVANVAHQYDVGGTVPGSFVPSANDVFDEPVPLSPVKIVEGGRLRHDIEEMYIRHGRQPEILRLDLHAQIAGNTGAAARLTALIDRYGAGTVAATMERILAAGERSFVEKLALVPDGTWREFAYFEAAREGDRHVHRIELAVTKRADRLRFSCAGTDPQIGILNTTWAAWRGGISTVIGTMLAGDQMFSTGGAMRHCDFEVTTGTISCADYPASVSCSGCIGGYTATILGNNVVAKMLDSTRELRGDLLANEACATWPLTAISGVDRRGDPFGTAILDPMIGGLGAFSFRDGVDTGGLYFIPRGRAANVEENEQAFPILYLYRRELPDSGGAGLFRGGNSGEFAIMPHGAEEITQTTAGCGYAVPTGIGLAGGHPACTSELTVHQDSGVLARLRAGQLPTDPRSYGRRIRLPSKVQAFTQGADDVYISHWSAGAGYGDPLRRDPELVARDVRRGAVTPATALGSYAVALTPDGELDAVATADARARALAARAAPAAVPPAGCGCGAGAAADPAALEPLSRHVGWLPATRRAHCAECGTDLGGLDCSYKRHAAVAGSPLEETNPLVGPPEELVDDPMEFRRFLCPGCRVQVATEVTRVGREPFADVTIEPY